MKEETKEMLRKICCCGKLMHGLKNILRIQYSGRFSEKLLFNGIATGAKFVFPNLSACVLLLLGASVKEALFLSCPHPLESSKLLSFTVWAYKPGSSHPRLLTQPSKREQKDLFNLSSTTTSKRR